MLLRSRIAFVLLCLCCACIKVMAVDDQRYVVEKKQKGSFPLVDQAKASPFYVDPNDYPGVLRAAKDLQQDVNRVSGIIPELFEQLTAKRKAIVIIGTIGKNALIDKLIREKKLNVSAISGKWETFQVCSITNPVPGVDQALVIVGSDKRGTIFGIYDVSQQIGVSPWFWWADVPVPHKNSLFVLTGVHSKGEPKVKYRGIFINDEQPALGGWVQQNYGGFNSKFYVKVFELILRLKGNFLWPAMWGQSIYSDDPLSPKLADEYGVVIGTSHHEPMMRAHVEWQREGGGPWNYATNTQRLQEFWQEGIRRMGDNESIVTLAMRGDGDEPMSEESNIQLLQRIVSDQRKILAETSGKDLTKIPQVWALYKEVQDYYDKGMRVPDDVTLLLCDDNWGNIRKLPDLKKPHPGGYGIYYHYDYVGDPRNYKWLNTNPIPKVWEQMHLAYKYDATKIWIVNVGDIKPMEFPIEFFLDYAWNPEKWSQDELQTYTELWTTREFGEAHGKEIARIISTYTKFNGRRKPELLAPDSFSPMLYSLTDYNEARKIVEEYKQLAADADKVNDQLPSEYRDSFYQLVLYPVKACANLNELFFTVRLNHLYAKQGRNSTNILADKVKQLFDHDAELSNYYNTKMSGGKWNHMMDQHHIGYIGWHDDFKVNTMPEVKRITTTVASEKVGIAIEGSDQSWTENSSNEIVLPAFNPYSKPSRYIELFNQGNGIRKFSIGSTVPWLIIEPRSGTVEKDVRISVQIDWQKAPNQNIRVPLTVKASDQVFTVYADLKNETALRLQDVKGHVETDGYVSIEAEHFTRAVAPKPFEWTILPDHGRTLSAVTISPVGESQELTKESAHLEYPIHFANPGTVKVHLYLSPTISFNESPGLRYGLSLDDDAPKVINMHEKNSHYDWQESVKNNIRVVTTDYNIKSPGSHVLKFWFVDPGVVLQKIVIDTGGLKPSYLGPPESFYQIK
jgi:hypothetical protein